MLLYEKSNLKVAEVFFDEPGQPCDADIVRYHFRTAPVLRGRSDGRHTLWIDLTGEPDHILAGMNKDTRYEIRRASKDGTTYQYQNYPDVTWMNDFFQFYDRFANGKGLPLANRKRLSAMLQDGALDLSRMCGPAGEVLVWHVHVRGRDRIRLLHSASLFRELDREAANVISRANRLHHWLDMQRFRDEGIPTFDFGGWYQGGEDTAKLRINDFKRGFGGTVVPQYNADCPATWKGAAALRLLAAYKTLRRIED